MAAKTKPSTQLKKSTGTRRAKSAASKVRRKNGELRKLDEPRSPMPAQHQRKPGLESKLSPRPKYQAPHYKGADKLRDKVALISGGDSGIGRAVAVLFAREGADVAITYLKEEKSDAEETRSAVEAEGGRALLMSGDVTGGNKKVGVNITAPK